MNSVTIYFWKEWREQRGTLGVLALVLLCGVAVLAAVLPKTAVQDPITFQVAIGLVILATVMSIGSDLLARERQLGAIAFLERVPGGLGTAFRAKLGFFVATLIAAACYGALLALCMSVARTGHLPREMLASSPIWLVVMVVAISLWVFAVSAWMPSGTLTFPATLLFLAVFAWPGVHAATGDRLFLPTTTQATVFVALCILGAPASAWAGFVLGARSNRPRRTAALFSLSTAALFFAPVWVWAGIRYVDARSAPFEIQWGVIGPGGRFAFLDLARKASDRETPKTWADERFSALIVDLEQGGWRHAGEVDASAFAEELAFARRRSLLGSDGCPRLELHAQGGDAAPRRIDGSTARELPAGSSSLDLALDPRPEDFGVHPAPNAYSIRWAGLGQALYFHDGNRRWVNIFRDPERSLCVDSASILPTLDEAALQDVRVRAGRWLALEHRRWIWFDPSTGKTEPVASFAADERLGPALDDGRFVLLAPSEVYILDPETGERSELQVVGRPDIGRLLAISTGPERSGPPIPTAHATLVFVHASRWMGPAVLDPVAGVLRLAKIEGLSILQWLASTGTRAILIEDHRRLVRYDFDRDRQEELFSVDSLE